jgi:pimeloyl-ACP methyl ester carboxylesterase
MLIKREVKVNGKNVYVVETIPELSSLSTTEKQEPSVILVSGLGMSSLTWCAVQRLLPPSLRSFSYDRFGLGKSDPPCSPREAVTLAKELKVILEACEVPKPYLLVGHSYGGVICREYLQLWNEDVAGLVYVDANHEQSHIERQWPMEAMGRMTLPPENLSDPSGLSDSHKCTEHEYEAIEEERRISREKRANGPPSEFGEGAKYESSLLALGSHDQLSRKFLTDRPLSVILSNLARDFSLYYQASKSAGLGTQEDHEQVDAFCARLPEVERRLGADMLRLSRVSRLILTSVSGHMVQLWEPELCVQEIIWCLSRAK